MISFDKKRHIYATNGVEVPHVTGILRPVTDYDGIPQDVLDAAAERGTAAHKEIEIAARALIASEQVSDDRSGYLDAYLSWYAARKPMILDVEIIVYDDLYGYAGTVDQVVRIGDDTWIVDLKTAATIGPWVALQLAAYENAYRRDRRKKPAKRMALQLKQNGTFREHIFADNGDLGVFLSLLTILKWRHKHGIETGDSTTAVDIQRAASRPDLRGELAGLRLCPGRG